MIAVTTFFLPLAPTLLVIASLALANRKLRLPAAEYCVLIGAGVAFAHVIWAAAIAVLGLNAPVLLHGFITMTLALGAAALCVIAFLSLGAYSSLTQSTLWLQVALLAAPLAIYFAWGSLPAQAWDSLDAWLVEASRFVAFQEGWLVGSPYYYDQRHPFTISALSATSVWTASTDEFAGVTLLLWSIACLSMALISFGYALYWQVDRRIAAVLAYAVLMTPLLENHYLLFGYADIWLAAVLVATLAVFDIGIRSHSRPFITFGVLLLLALLLLKNIGIVFAVTLLMVVGCIFVASKISFKLLVAFIAATCFLAILKVEHGSTKIESVFDVSIEGDFLEISSKRCGPEAFADKFIVTVVPENPADLEPVVSKWVAAKFPGLDVKVFRKKLSSVISPLGKCDFNIYLGDYDKKLIRVGQLSESNHPNWMSILIPGADQYSIRGLGLSVQIGEIIVVNGVVRDMILELSSPVKVARNFFHAHFLNSSYSLWTGLLLLATLYFSFAYRRLGVQEAFILIASWSLLGVLLSSQIFVIDLFNTSLPQSDTRYSRFILWLPTAALLATLSLFGAGGASMIYTKR